MAKKLLPITFDPPSRDAVMRDPMDAIQRLLAAHVTIPRHLLYGTWPPGTKPAMGSTSTRTRVDAPYDGVRVGEVTAYRAWWVRGHMLYSLFTGHRWLPGVPMTGDVDARYSGTAGGVYALKSPEDVHGEFVGPWGERRAAGIAIAIGRVLLSGEVVEGSRGYRASVATVDRVLTISPEPSSDQALRELNELYAPPHRVPERWTEVYDDRDVRIGFTTQTFEPGYVRLSRRDPVPLNVLNVNPYRTIMSAYATRRPHPKFVENESVLVLPSGVNPADYLGHFVPLPPLPGERS